MTEGKALRFGDLPRGTKRRFKMLDKMIPREDDVFEIVKLTFQEVRSTRRVFHDQERPNRTALRLQARAGSGGLVFISDPAFRPTPGRVLRVIVLHRGSVSYAEPLDATLLQDGEWQPDNNVIVDRIKFYERDSKYRGLASDLRTVLWGADEPPELDRRITCLLIPQLSRFIARPTTSMSKDDLGGERVFCDGAAVSIWNILQIPAIGSTKDDVLAAKADRSAELQTRISECHPSMAGHFRDQLTAVTDSAAKALALVPDITDHVEDSEAEESVELPETAEDIVASVVAGKKPKK